MSKFIKTCRVCGKEYEYCRTLKPIVGVDRWQDVACCPEHATQYFAQVYEMRGKAVAEIKPAEYEAHAEEAVEIADGIQDGGDLPPVETNKDSTKQPRRKKNGEDTDK